MEPKVLEEAIGRIDKGIPALMSRIEVMDKKFTPVEEGVKSLGSRLQSIEDWKKGLATTGAVPQERGLPGAEQKKFSMARALCGIVNHTLYTDKRFGYEAEVIREYHKLMGRDLSTTIDSGAGFLVPPQVMTDLIEILRPKIVAVQLGATTLTGLSGAPVIIPKQTGAGTIYGTSENASINPSAQTVGQVTMMPHEAAGLVKVSNLLLQLSNPSVDAMINEDLTKIMARYIDLKSLLGTGGGVEPLGILNTTGVLSKSIGAIPTIDNLYAMDLSIDEANAIGGRMGWAMAPRTRDTLRRTKDGEGRYFIAPDPTKGMVGASLIGYPVATSTQIPKTLGATADRSALILGNWEELIIGLWGTTEIKASDVTSDAFAKNQTHVRIIQQFDVAVRHEVSFCVDQTIAA